MSVFQTNFEMNSFVEDRIEYRLRQFFASDNYQNKLRLMQEILAECESFVDYYSDEEC